MATIGIHPNFKKRYQWMYHNLVRDAQQAGLKVVSGRFDHLVSPGQKVKTKPATTHYTGPFNGGGAAA